MSLTRRQDRQNSSSHSIILAFSRIWLWALLNSHWLFVDKYECDLSVVSFFSVSLSRFLFWIILVKKYNLWSGAILIASSIVRSCLILNSIIARLIHTTHLFVHIIGIDVNLLFFFSRFYLNKNACPHLYIYITAFWSITLCLLRVLVLRWPDWFLTVCQSMQVIGNGKNIDSSFACLLFICWFSENTARVHPTTTQNQHSLFAVFLPSRFSWCRGVCASARPSISFFRLKSCALLEKPA